MSKKQPSGPPVKVRQLKKIDGIMSCMLTHDVVETEHEFKWHGPKLNDIWPEVLAFFKWTNDTMRSESQVRLFVNTQTQQWKAHAFPQKARTGMNAKEITEGEEGYEKTKEQRQMFSDTDGWYYWGTVHHHCSTSAFQSGTDQENERNQDGLHITVGFMDKEQHDIHARMYISGQKIREPNLLSLFFWDVGDAYAGVPAHIRPLLPVNCNELIARAQMGATPPAGTEFPEIWRTNVMDITPKVVAQYVAPAVVQQNFGGNHYGVSRRPFCDRSKPNFVFDLRKGAEALALLVESKPGLELKDALQILAELARVLDDDMLDILDVCCQNDCLPDSLVDYICKQMVDDEKDKQRRSATREEILGEAAAQAQMEEDGGWRY